MNMNVHFLIGCVTAIITVAMAGYFLVHLRQGWHSRSWPWTVAVILTSEMIKDDDNSSRYDVAVT
ncbi:hypothetical protein [Massilia scottii]|uniref:hypothetical protein n=1 Tax=Massilia scottii TaxID=3057166 RepID=UPI002796D741|nr:hypothetical protein [Massilia sp. CCM 9029]MDQ1833887.1 hypothetical protein [Massilia sp. CCM 9029]